LRLILCYFIFGTILACSRHSKKVTGILELVKPNFQVSETITLFQKKDIFRPLRSVLPGTVLEIEEGSYLIATDCSMFEFKVENSQKKVIFLSELEISVASSQKGVGLATPLVHTKCIDPLDKEVHESRAMSRYVLLPGKTSIEISSQAFNFESVHSESKKFVVPVFPLSLESPQTFNKNKKNNDSYSPQKYFVSEGESQKVLSFSVDEVAYFPEGRYTLELNGTKMNVEVNESISKIPLGILEIDSPAKADASEKFVDGNRPVFAFINDGVLFNLDKEYLVFPGEYFVGMQGSEYRENFLVSENQKTTVFTSGVLIEPPPCQEKQCTSIPTITIHKDEKTFPIMSIPAGQSFLLLKGSFEFGVEGIRGIMKKMSSISGSTGRLFIEKLSRVKISWKNILSDKLYKTDYARIESKDTRIIGKSLDLLYNKPSDILLPPGNYAFTYFVQEPSGARPKTSIFLNLSPGEISEVSIPLYSPRVTFDGSTASPRSSKAAQPETIQAPEKLSGGSKGTKDIPKGLEPLRK
jgi:hypothetical protein